MKQRKQRIAMFDSGLGGLTVLAALRRLLPDAHVAYAADTARVPYGDRSLEEVAGFAQQMIARLREDDPSLLIIACGTTCSAFDQLGIAVPELPTLPIVDCGVRAAASQPAAGHIGVIATAATIGSGIFERKLKHALSDTAMAVTSIAAPKLVPLVESGNWASEEAHSAVDSYCREFREAGCETVILGCTHFPLLRSWFEQSLGSGVRIIDPAIECAAAAAHVLHGFERSDGSLVFEVSGDEHDFLRAARELTGMTPSSARRVDFSALVAK